MAEVQSGFRTDAEPFPRKLYHNQALLGQLTATAAAGRLCHAYLFYGERGVGKKTFISHLAAALLCKSEIKERPCGACSSCKKAFEGGHPDIMRYGGKRGANGFHIETVREIRQDAFILPNESDFKLYLLFNVEDMSPGAANAFLKVLEEPPAHVVFLLTADNPERVMETVRSRCVLQELFPMPEGELEAALSELFPEQEEAGRSSAAAMADGFLGRAIEILENTDYAEIAALSDRLADGLAAGNEYELLAALNGANQSKERMRLLLNRFSHTLRAALLTRLARGEGNRLAARLTAAQMERVYGELEKARAAIVGNVNLGILTNYLSLCMMRAVEMAE